MATLTLKQQQEQRAIIKRNEQLVLERRAEKARVEKFVASYEVEMAAAREVLAAARKDMQALKAMYQQMESERDEYKFQRDMAVLDVEKLQAELAKMKVDRMVDAQTVGAMQGTISALQEVEQSQRAQETALEKQVAEYRAALADIAAMKWEDAFGVTEIASGDLDAKTLEILAALGARKEEGEMSIGTLPQVPPIAEGDDLQKTLELLRQKAHEE